MRTIYLILLFPLLIGACSKRLDNDREIKILEHVERIIESSPDSSLVLLRSIDKSRLHRASEKAKYSLLMSMALDKNYIDIEEDMELELLVQEFELEPEKYEKVDEKNTNLTMLKTPTNKFLKTLNKITI